MRSPAWNRILRPTSSRSRAVTRLLLLQTITTAGFFISSCSGSLPNPTRDISSAEAILELGTAVVQLREDNAVLQAQIDSLRVSMVYQDSIIRQLAVLSNVTMRPPSISVP